jgi:ABC-type polysaccharide/polyol phosphate transport system ATPase subunit
MSVTARSPAAAPVRSPATAPAVRIAHVSKSFRLPHQRYHTLKERVLHPFQSSTYDVLHAVDDVNLDVMPGEFFGIVGRNGSGKSTLLKCIAGIYNIDAGELTVRGRLSPFIELGVGFNMDLTARDNVMINAIMLGLTRKQARERFDEIIAFAELERFVDQKLKDYSTGMQLRLAYAVAVQTPFRILFLDEVLAVGDERFQRKCHDTFLQMQAEGKTVVLVSHNLEWVNAFCDRVLLLRKGTPEMCGAPGRVIEHYVQTEAT